MNSLMSSFTSASSDPNMNSARAGELGLAHTGGTEEDKWSRSAASGPSARHRHAEQQADRSDRLVLADDPLVEASSIWSSRSFSSWLMRTTGMPGPHADDTGDLLVVNLRRLLGRLFVPRLAQLLDALAAARLLIAEAGRAS